jgi:L-rhamnose mutarotase
VELLRGTEMAREAFRVRLKPGALEAWVAAHEEVWPELLEVQGRCGFTSMTVYALDDRELLVVSEVSDEGSWERLVDTDVHRRWVLALAHLSASAQPDGDVARAAVREVLHLDWPDG